MISSSRPGRELTLRSGPDAPGAARAAATEWLDGCVDDATLDDVRLLVSELVTNGCLHADVPSGRSLELSASVADGMVRLAVRDDGQDGSVAVRPMVPDMAGGFGLRLVDAITTRWGVDYADGTVVWCELPAYPRPRSRFGARDA